MNASITVRAARAAILGLALGLVATLFLGCATTKKVDWDGRLGRFTYDQAVAEMGPPARSAVLKDGQLVAEWVIRRAVRPAFSMGVGYYGGAGGVSAGQSTGSGERVLRLTFGQDGKLAQWTKIMR